MKTWIVPCNISNYKVFEAFDKLKTLNWKQSRNYEVGDIVYIYTSSPYSKITHKTIVTQVNLTEAYIDDRAFIIDGKPFVNFGRYMTLEFIKKIDSIDFQWLKRNGLKGNIQWPRVIDFEINE